MTNPKADPPPISAFIESAMECARDYAVAAEEIETLVDVTEHEIEYVRRMMTDDGGMKASHFAHRANWLNVHILIGMAQERARTFGESAQALETAAIAAHRLLKAAAA